MPCCRRFATLQRMLKQRKLICVKLSRSPLNPGRSNPRIIGHLAPASYQYLPRYVGKGSNFV